MRAVALLLFLLASATLPAVAAPAPASVASAPATDAAVPPGTASDTGATTGTSSTDAATAPAVPAAAAWAPQLRRDAEAVLSGADFKGTKTSRDLVPRDWLRRWLTPKADTPDKPPDLRWLPAVAEIVKWLLVALLVAAFTWLLWRGWQWLSPQLRDRRAHSPPEPLCEATSIALADTPLPTTVSRAARAAWQAGDAEQALSLLYRGALRALDQHYRIELPASATEGECLRRARASGKAVVGSGFAPVVQAWMGLAYARRLPADFEQLLALYVRHFEARGDGEARS